MASLTLRPDETTWVTWCSDTTCTDSLMTAYDVNETTWAEWTGGSATTTTTITGDTWGTWSNDHFEVRRARKRAEREQRRAERRAAKAHRKATAKRERAKRKAERLLLETLTDEQRAEWAAHRQFTVWSRDRKREYVIKSNTHQGNVHRRINGRLVTSYCAAPRGSLPIADHLLAQKLHIEENDLAFLRVANVHWDQRTEDERTADQALLDRRGKPHQQAA